jgi:hypothetical protein
VAQCKSATGCKMSVIRMLVRRAKPAH